MDLGVYDRDKGHRDSYANASKGIDTICYISSPTLEDNQSMLAVIPI